MRGKLVGHLSFLLDERIIPAHAGQTTCSEPTNGRRPDHPRACGANCGTLPIALAMSGSSPRMRGKLLLIEPEYLASRIIPAHAGQTSSRNSYGHHYSDHPRACGANLNPRRLFFSTTGSSPRMRGKRRRRDEAVKNLRIIPAHAGQTVGSLEQFQIDSDHPRACGANQGVVKDVFVLDGSSPRMRGKRSGAWNSFKSIRIIPAHAGQTECGTRARGRRTDHPRACGANRWNINVFRVSLGSSPRMRGKRKVDVDSLYHRRIIPAHAGQTPV